MTVRTSPVGEVEGRISCDATDCVATVTAVASGSFKAYDLVVGRAKGAGWSSWSSRTARHYCPQHVPRPGHRMRKLW